MSVCIACPKRDVTLAVSLPGKQVARQVVTFLINHAESEHIVLCHMTADPRFDCKKSEDSLIQKREQTHDMHQDESQQKSILVCHTSQPEKARTSNWPIWLVHCRLISVSLLFEVKPH